MASRKNGPPSRTAWSQSPLGSGAFFVLAEKAPSARSLAPTYPRKGPLGSPARLQAPSQRLAVATTFSRVGARRRCALSRQGGLEGNGRPWPAKTHPVNGFFLPRAGPATAPVAGGVPPAAPRGRKVRLAPALFLYWQKKRHPPAPLLPLIREKARSARLLGCKRPPNGSLSLPPFRGWGQGGVVLYRGRGDSKGTAGLG